MASQEGSSTRRCSLFPTSYKESESSSYKCVSFSPYARCIRMEPQNLNDDDKSRIWWQKSDYEDFARVSRIISEAMLEVGSEIWLGSKSSPSSTSMLCNDMDHESKTECTTKPDGNTITECPSSLTLVNPPLHYDYDLDSNPHELYRIRNKWWCKFGHSRRGLEHFASTVEGKERRLNNRSALRSVLEEQRRQALFLPKGYFDVEKLRTAYFKETQWARILAQAAGESDANAVETNFDDSRMKPREYYLKKQFDIKSDYMSTVNRIYLPIFMKALIWPNCNYSFFDTNTVSQIGIQNSREIFLNRKRREEIDRVEIENKTKTLTKIADYGTPREEEIEYNSSINNWDTTVSLRSIEDPTSSLATMAVGWGSDDSTRTNRTVG